MKNCKRNRLRAWTFRPAQQPLPPSPTLTIILRAKFGVMGKIAGQLSRFFQFVILTLAPFLQVSNYLTPFSSQPWNWWKWISHWRGRGGA